MRMHTLGKTGLSVSPICIGAWQLAGPLSLNGKPDGHPEPGKRVVLRMIQELGDMGVNFIDTAEQYGNGESERRVGEAIRGQRDRWIVSTKFGYRVGPDGERDDSSSPHTIVPSLEGSLKRLRTDCVDIYLYHCPPLISELEAAKTVLERLVQEGKCRFYGISTNNSDVIKAMLDLDMLDVLQYPSNMLQDATAIHALVSQHNVGTQVRGVMAQGRLSGKYFHRAPTWDADDNRSHGVREEDYRRYAVFEAAIPDGYTMAQVAIRWVLDHPCNHSICLGAKNIDDYKVALAAIDMPPISPEDRERLAACAARLSSE
ncbi:MAG: aldo/keto reductase [Verrucomicrobia bacterium]|jgi:aryl-alcohol dehydrogenase-like predicted oxidoreductase|nr:aldo/keto reductase [Verrucomicrobiota bacterium]MBT7067865.1 aldo/keto reductase [Verrucomicrobiota bacterium]MBT7699868.1 aldo/keto reductase [Verrucomicrobiota bacterium]